MMKKTLSVLIVILFANGLLGQTDDPSDFCLPDGIEFETQSQIDNFQTNYPNCTEVGGDVLIDGEDITNLYGLSVLTSIHGNLKIAACYGESSNPDLISLEGLSNLEYIGGDFNLCGNASLINLSGLGNISVIEGELIIMQNDSLLNLEGLDALIYVGGNVQIWFNDLITNLEGLNNLSFIGGDFLIEQNDKLMNFQGLNNLSTIMGSAIIGCIYEWQPVHQNPSLASFEGLENLYLIGGDLGIWTNPVMTNLTGLSSLSIIQGRLQIIGNETLSDLTGLETLKIVNSIGIYYNPHLNSLSGINNVDPGSVNGIFIFNNPELSHCNVQSVCDYLISPNGPVNILNNATGCNNPSEIAIQCGTTLPCLPYGNYFLTSQAEVDSFQYLYAGCSDLGGDILIGGADITNLEGLSVINSVSGSLEVGISYWPVFYSNPLLESLSGLDGLSSVGKNVSLHRNSMLSDLSGLGQLVEIGESFEISYNDTLSSLDGLDNLESIGGDLNIWGNNNLTSLEGLENIESESMINLTILENPLLATCHVQSICDYLASPNGIVKIENNASGCNTQQEVEEACEVVSIDEIFNLQDVNIYPSPSSGTIHLRYSISDIRYSKLELYSIQGIKVRTLMDQMQPPGEYEMAFDISDLPAGMYFVRMQIGQQVQTMKLMLIK